ncbi:MAG: glycosyltransferase N-terminal domain-containing protein [Candidatus Hydrothermales bacterium]
MIDILYKSLSFLTYPIAQKRLIDSDLEKDSIWFHAASLGEVTSIKPLLDYFDKKGVPFYVTTMTESGKKRADEYFKGRVFLFPYDNPLLIKKLVDRTRLLVLAESEFWPNTIFEVKKNKKNLILVNGRISEKSFLRWKLLKGYFARILSCFDKFFVISFREKKFLRRFNVDGSKIFVSGNLKILFENKDVSLLFEKPFDFTITFASVRTGEFSGIVDVIEKIMKMNEKIGFIIAVRHLESLILLENILKLKKIKYVKFSEERENFKYRARVLILDTLGDLIRVFPISDVAVVCGTFAPYGGHNLLEPAQFGVPVFFGPYTFNVKGMEEILIKEGGGIKCKDFNDLFTIFKDMIDSRDELIKVGKNSKNAYEKARKISENGFRKIVEYIEKNL